MNMLHSMLGWLNRYRSVFLLTFAGLVLLLAQSSFWINQTIFDQATCTSITTEVLESEKSREAVAKTVVDRTLSDRPIVKRVAGEKATQLITGLLGTDLASQTISTVINKSYAYLTSAEQEVIDIDLLPIKTPLAGLVSFAESQGREVTFDPGSIPDAIVLFDPVNLPDVHSVSQKMLWFGPLCWLTAFGLFGAYLYRGHQVYAKRVYIVGAIILISSVLGLLIGPLAPQPIAASVPIIELRPVVSDLVSALLEPFTRQMFVTIGITLLVLAVFSQRGTIARFVQKLLAGTRKEAPQALTPGKTVKKSVSAKKPRKKSRPRR